MAAKPAGVDVLRAQIDAELANVPRGTSPPPYESAPIEAYADLEPGGFSDTDIANSRRFAAQHGQDVKYTAARSWFVWDGRRWAPDEKGILVQEKAKRTAISIFDEVATAADQNQIFKHAKRSQAKRSIDAITALGRSEPGIPAKITDFDQNGWLFNVRNGTVDLRAGTLRQHSKADLITSVAEVDYDPSAEYELWDSFLWRVTAQNHDLYDYIRRFVGYLLVADTSDQSLHFLYGLGANGKSVFCEVLQRLMGDYAVTASPDLIMARRHGGIPNDVARLRGVRAALMNETSQGSRFDEAKLKDLTGSDTLSARFLNHEFFDFSPTHRLIIRGNHKPAINGTDDGIWRRLRLIPFTVSIPLDEQDRDLLSKLRGELSGILNWAIQGCLEWQKSGLRPPDIITEAVRKYREESDTLGRFILENCAVSKLAQVKSGTLYQRYHEFAEAASERPMPQRDMPNEMERRGFTYKRATGGVRIYEGIELNTKIATDWTNY